MKKEIATGIQDFESVIVDNRFYIDKTELISLWWKNADEVTVINRPRRFGKTLNMSMLNCFFSNKYENRSDLFEGLSVWKDPELQAEQGKWPMISLSFAGVKAATFSEARYECASSVHDKQRET
ncbi:MAG: AAA family ATPase [Clostridia bacterium]|nr:AAA family ATPase [Clostridia bacterium]